MCGGVDPSSQADAQALGQATKHDWKLREREIVDIAGQGQFWFRKLHRSGPSGKMIRSGEEKSQREFQAVSFLQKD